MRKKVDNLWVDPEFKNRFKAAASLRGLTIADYSRELMRDSDNLEKQLSSIAKRPTIEKRSFNMRL